MPKQKSQLTRAEKAGYFAADLVQRALIGAMLLLPYETRVAAMGWFVSRVVAPLAGLRRRVRRNLALVRPDLDGTEVERLVRAVPDNAGRTLIELYSGADFARRAGASPLRGPGVAALEAARAAKRPTILITGHFGNYLAARAALATHGHSVGALYRRMANPYFNDHYVAAMAKTGPLLFEQGRRGMTQMVRHLREGGIIAIVGDLHVHSGTEIDFFGEPALTSLVPAELALKHDALLLPIYAIRQANGLDFEVEIQAPIAHTDARDMARQVNDGLERLVRAHMGQWFWIHRRWKKFPGPAADAD